MILGMKRFVVFWVLLLVGMSGVLLWAQQSQQVGVLALGAEAGETDLVVEWSSPGTVGTAIMIESRDGSTMATNMVREIFGKHLILKEKLGDHFPAGSRLYQ